MFHGAHALSYQSLLKMMSSPSVKNRIDNYFSSDVDETITDIQTGEISQAKAVCEYVISRQLLAQKCKNKIENVAEKRPGYLPVMGES